MYYDFLGKIPENTGKLQWTVVETPLILNTRTRVNTPREISITIRRE